MPNYAPRRPPPLILLLLRLFRFLLFLHTFSIIVLHRNRRCGLIASPPSSCLSFLSAISLLIGFRCWKKSFLTSHLCIFPDSQLPLSNCVPLPFCLLVLPGLCEYFFFSSSAFFSDPSS